MNTNVVIIGRSDLANTAPHSPALQFKERLSKADKHAHFIMKKVNKLQCGESLNPVSATPQARIQ